MKIQLCEDGGGTIIASKSVTAWASFASVSFRSSCICSYIVVSTSGQGEDA